MGLDSSFGFGVRLSDELKGLLVFCFVSASEDNVAAVGIEPSGRREADPLVGSSNDDVFVSTFD